MAGSAAAAVRGAEEQLVLKDGRRIPRHADGAPRRARCVFADDERASSSRCRRTRSSRRRWPRSPCRRRPPRRRCPRRRTSRPRRTQTLVLKDGRRIQVLRLARRGGLVLFQTTRGEALLRHRGPGRLAAARDRSRRLDRPGATAPTPPPPPGRAARVTPPADRADCPGARSAPTRATHRPRLPVGVPRLRAAARPLDDPLSPTTRRIVKGRTLDPYNQNDAEGRQARSSATPCSSCSPATLETSVRGRAALPVGSGVSAERAGQPRVLRPRRAALHDAARRSSPSELFKGQTAFRPKTWALKVTGAVQPELPARRASATS